jgi:hypothetical protein
MLNYLKGRRVMSWNILVSCVERLKIFLDLKRVRPVKMGMVIDVLIV